MRTVGLAAFAAVLAAKQTRRAPRRRPARRVNGGGDDLVLVGDLVVLGLLAGSSFLGALAAATRHVPGPLAEEISRLVRRARAQGSAAALAVTDGRLGPLVAVAARAVTTGAPIAAAIAAFTADARNAARAAAVADARRLSVRLLFPLALLILPGFVLLVAGPFVLDGVMRLDL